MVSANVWQTADELEPPADESLPLCNSFEVNSRTFTRKSSLRSKKLEAAGLLSGPNGSAGGDAVERVRRNGGESMVVDYAGDVDWPCDDVSVKDHIRQARADYLPDMVDLQIIAKARLQEKGSY